MLQSFRAKATVCCLFFLQLARVCSMPSPDLLTYTRHTCIRLNSRCESTSVGTLLLQ